MISRFKDSLLMSMGAVMAAITLLAFASMAASFFIADTTQGLATAINESGTLRMRSYEIASQLTYDNIDDNEHWKKTHRLIKEFEEHLHSPKLTNVLKANNHHHFRTAYKKIQQQWLNDIKPLFEIYLDGLDIKSPSTRMDLSISKEAVTNLRNRYFMVVADFANNIDALALMLEENSEAKISHLRNFQIFSLSLTMILILIALLLIYTRIQKPLKQLLIGAERVSRSDFSFHINNTGKDELGRLGSAFNSMSEDLSIIYNELENRVKQKTRDLENSNRSLELLYKTVNRLNEADSPHTTYADILNDIKNLSGAGRGSICLNNNKKENASMIASTSITDNLSKILCQESHCKKCLNIGESQFINDIDNNNKQLLTIPITYKSQQYGVLVIEPDTHQHINEWQQQLLESVAYHIGIAINVSQQSNEKRRIALIEERGAIARELHDSLAQSLTFMKIQVSRLQALTEKKYQTSNKQSEESSIIAELRIGLNSAYKELRELLTTFRLKIDDQDFNQALSKTILEFNERSNTQISYENEITYFNLTPNEEIHTLQLIRESLSNIVQHAHASKASLLIQYTSAGNILVIIKDNGIGIGSSQSKSHHYGLSIMKERAQTLNGTLEITNNHDAGTQVKLNFIPVHKIAPIQLKTSN